MAISAAPVSITPLHPCLGARVEGADLTQPLPDAVFRRIADAFEEYSVLVFRDQRLTDAQQKAFSERWGPLELTIISPGQEARYDPRLVDLSNTDPDHGGLMDWSDRRMIYQSGNQLWHTDSSFKPVPAHSSALSGREVPPVGGETEFASVHSFLQRLERKGLISRDRSGFVHVFAAAASQADVAGQELAALADKLAGGSLAPFLMHLIDQRRLSEEEADEIRRLLDAYEPPGRPDRRASKKRGRNAK